MKSKEQKLIIQGLLQSGNISTIWGFCELRNENEKLPWRWGGGWTRLLGGMGEWGREKQGVSRWENWRQWVRRWPEASGRACNTRSPREVLTAAAFRSIAARFLFSPSSFRFRVWWFWSAAAKTEPFLSICLLGSYEKHLLESPRRFGFAVTFFLFSFPFPFPFFLCF